MNREIKEALKICSEGCSGDGCAYIPECDGLDCGRCIDTLARDALELIEEQERIINKLIPHCYNVDVNALLGRKVI